MSDIRCANPKYLTFPLSDNGYQMGSHFASSRIAPAPLPGQENGLIALVRREKAAIFSGCNSHPARGRSSR